MHASNEPQPEPEIRGADPKRDYDGMSEFDAGDDFPLANQLLDEAYARKKEGNFKAAEKLMLVARAYLDVKCEIDEEAANTAVNYRAYLLLGNLYYDMGEWKKGFDAFMKCAWTWDMVERRNQHKYIPGPMIYYPNLKRCEDNEAAQREEKCWRRVDIEDAAHEVIIGYQAHPCAHHPRSLHQSTPMLALRSARLPALDVRVDASALTQILSPVDADPGSAVDPAVADDLLYEAMENQRVGAYDEAERLFLATRAYLLMKRPRSVSTSTSELAMSPINYRTHVLLGNLYHETRNWGKAASFYSAACEIWNKDAHKECVLHPTFFLSNLKECTRELEKASKRQRMQLNFVLLIFLLVCWKLRFIHWLAVYLLDL
ncbi:hypothetical protein EXIGLDRAFT_745657 [Exidia glandulosa HHB12029]|uniref:TPR-like protein n=1 Tax=Exidia glandulosa HHB12029 TaxID=1314781 RepID=A0A165N987_EXIGL|nr:hypothetical protein EXIGLDRAFT_745657 [Exidia glandulosa HHB12029]